MGKKMHVIREHNPLRVWVMVGVALFLVLAGYFALYSYMQSQCSADWRAAAQFDSERRKLNAEAKRLRGENRDLSERLVRLEKGEKIDDESSAQVRDQMREHEAEVSALKEQLAFYRSILSPEETEAGVRIYSMDIQDGPEKNLYQYQLLLIQSVRHRKEASVSARVTIHGLTGGKASKLALDDIDIGRRGLLNYKFRYFQERDGTFKLPADFKPTRVEISVTGKDSITPVVEKYNWAEIYSGA